MRALFDVNMLLALFDDQHIHAARASRWWRAHDAAGWASCPLTENGFVRILSQSSYPGSLPVHAALVLFQRQTGVSDHAFWPDDISIADPAVFDHSRIIGPRQVTDVYLLALAVKNGGCLVTLDRTIALAAVRGAAPDNLVVV